ncbi:MAG: putative Holliday junction resolvase [Polyangiales bacterium]
MSRILGVDPGKKRVGLALSDDAAGTVALPLGLFERTGNDEKTAYDLAAHLDRTLEEGNVIVGIVMGLPLRLDGRESTASKRVRRFGTALGETMNMEVHYWDERMTTVAAEGALRSMGMSARKQRHVVDATAATLLLQSFLDAQTNG